MLAPQVNAPLRGLPAGSIAGILWAWQEVPGGLYSAGLVAATGFTLMIVILRSAGFSGGPGPHCTAKPSSIWPGLRGSVRGLFGLCLVQLGTVLTRAL